MTDFLATASRPTCLSGETWRPVTSEAAAAIRRRHADAFNRMAGQVRPLPGARELLAFLSKAGVPWAIATSGRMETARADLEALGVDAVTPVITRDQVPYAKPDPALFLPFRTARQHSARVPVLVFHRFRFAGIAIEPEHTIDGGGLVALNRSEPQADLLAAAALRHNPIDASAFGGRSVE